ncbi:glycosyltransferase [Microbacterium sp. NPDC056569]|uniref:glycosyltransferase n=1 Tax=Microbacterium sp. NPDC056569 TaxID=3345867 RepID=UPI00366BF425
MAPSTSRLPVGRHFAVTWSIPDDFGGMTEAMLRRSRAFDRVCATPVDVLTFDARPDYPELVERLRADGALSGGIRILNLYDWLRDHELPAVNGHPEFPTADPALPADSDGAVRLRGGDVMSRLRQDAQGRVLQVDHLRQDGSLLLTDRREVPRRGEPGGRRLVLHDRQGRPVRSWRRIWDLYADWLDALTAGQSSYFIVDSKTVAGFMAQYRRRHVVTAHLVHGSHRDAAGQVKASRRAALERAHRFDVVAVLSRSQARDMRRDLSPSPFVAVVSNPHDGDRPPPSQTARAATSGVVVAALTRRKRVSHAIAAVRDANVARTTPITLDVYGDGESRTALARSARDDPNVRLHGHVPRARERLGQASFALFTAHSEGFPLALVEAMAAGCVPIAYDIDYGPADIIRHRRNGYLIEAGDVDGLADAIAEVVDQPEWRRRRLRARAIAATRDFTDEAVCAQWANAFELALLRRALRRTPAARTLLRRWPHLRRAPAFALRAAALLARTAAEGRRRPAARRGVSRSQGAVPGW